MQGSPHTLSSGFTYLVLAYSLQNLQVTTLTAWICWTNWTKPSFRAVDLQQPPIHAVTSYLLGQDTQHLWMHATKAQGNENR